MGTFERVARIVAGVLSIDVDEVKAESSLANDLNADSIDIVELEMSIEQEFDVEIDSRTSEQIVTVGDFVKFVDALGATTTN